MRGCESCGRPRRDGMSEASLCGRRKWSVEDWERYCRWRESVKDVMMVEGWADECAWEST